MFQNYLNLIENCILDDFQTKCHLQYLEMDLLDYQKMIFMKLLMIYFEILK